MTDDRYRSLRLTMVETQLRARDIRDPRVLEAMATVPRERFVPESQRSQAYADRALPARSGQTISQPYIVAYMTEALQVRSGQKVMEIGTGTGYQSAILATVADDISVFTIERLPELSIAAQEALKLLGIKNVRYRVGDGSLGWEEHAPYDRIVVTAGSPEVPGALTDQLADGGIMVIPTGPAESQVLTRVTRRGDRIERESLLGCRFVKLIGRQAWHESH